MGDMAMLKIIHKLCKSKKVATAIEYGLIAALISIAAIAAFQLLGESLTSIFSGIASSVSNATPSTL